MTPDGGSNTLRITLKYAHSYLHSYLDHNYHKNTPWGYCSSKAVQTVSPVVEYDSIQNAYVAASSPQTILAKATLLNENLDFAGGKVITLRGGYDCYFSTTPGYTTVHSLTISGTGRVTISRVKIR